MKLTATPPGQDGDMGTDRRLWEDGHLRVSSWVQATVRVSRREALDVVRLADVATALPVVFDHLAAGTLGTRQAGDLARVHANPRIRDALPAVVESFVTVAERARTTSSSRS